MPRTARHIAQVYNIAAAPKKVAAGVTAPATNAKEIPWGKNHNLPLNYLRLIDDSGTANSCVDALVSFIFADGFRDADNAAVYMVNPTQTADSLLQDLAGDIATLEGVAIRVRYNLEGVRAEFEYLPFEKVCKLDNGMFQYNPTYGEKKFDKSLTEVIPAYNPEPEAVQEVLAAAAENPDAAQVGQLYYYYVKRKGAYHYPKPPYATTGGLADIESDCAISIFDRSEIKNSFMPNAILTRIGVPEVSTDKDGNPIESEYEREFIEQLKAFTGRGSGEEGSKKLLVLDAESKDNVPVLQAFDGSATINAMGEITDRIGRKVCRHFSTPPVLVGFSTAGQLGNNQEIVNSIQLFQIRIQKYQMMLQRVFEELMPEEISGVSDWGITTLNPIKFLPPEVVARMTDNEIRELGGLPPVEDGDSVLAALKALPQNIAAEVMKNMTAEQLLAFVGLTPTPQPNGTPNQ